MQELWFIDGYDPVTRIINFRRNDGRRYLALRTWDGQYEILRPDHPLWYWEM